MSKVSIPLERMFVRCCRCGGGAGGAGWITSTWQGDREHTEVESLSS